MAIKYYDKGDYFRALQLFDGLISIYRGTPKSEKIYYYYAYCHYYQEDYILASYHFRNLAMTLPNSQYAEECLYMSAYCQYLDSPDYTLDPTNTYTAIKELQNFINKYPKSPKVQKCNELIDVLRQKLETKFFEIGKLYFNTDEYNASIISFNNLLKDFPNTKYREESLFYILRANFSYAENSIETKKAERFKNTINAYNIFISAYPSSSFNKEAENINKISTKELNKYNIN